MRYNINKSNTMIVKIDRPAAGRRLVSMFLDHFLTCIILIAPVFLFASLTGMLNEGEKLPPEFQFVSLGLMILYFLKDSFNGRSLAKRITKLQVMDNRTLKTASAGQCFVRNLTFPIWPIEVIIIFFRPDRRLGDLLAGTRVVNYDTAPVPSFEFE